MIHMRESSAAKTKSGKARLVEERRLWAGLRPTAWTLITPTTTLLLFLIYSVFLILVYLLQQLSSHTLPLHPA